MNSIKLSLIFFWLIPISSLAQNQTSRINIGNHNIINGILNTGNYTRINQFQVSIKDPSHCQVRHFANYNSLSRKFQIALIQYNSRNSISKLHQLDSLLSLIQSELNLLVTCGLEKKIKDLSSTLSCPYDYLERGDFFYGNLDFLNALLWYADAQKCVTDKNLKHKIELKIKVCKRKLISYEDFLSNKEFSEITLLVNEEKGRSSIHSKDLSSGKILTIIAGGLYNEYRIAHSAVIHDPKGKVYAHYPFDEIEYDQTKFLGFSFVQNNGVLFFAQRYDSTLKLYLYDSLGKLTKIRNIYTSGSQPSWAVNSLMLGVSTAHGFTCLDHNLNILFEKKFPINENWEWVTQANTLFFNDSYKYSRSIEYRDTTPLQVYTLNYNNITYHKLEIPQDSFEFKGLSIIPFEQNIFMVIKKTGNLMEDTVCQEYLVYNKTQLVNRYLHQNDGFKETSGLSFIKCYDSYIEICRKWYVNGMLQIDTVLLSIFNNQKTFRKTQQPFSHLDLIEIQSQFKSNYIEYKVHGHDVFEWVKPYLTKVGSNTFLTAKWKNRIIKLPDLTLKKYYYKNNLRNPENIRFFSGKRINVKVGEKISWMYIQAWDKWIKTYYNNIGISAMDLYNEITDPIPVASRSLPSKWNFFSVGYAFGDQLGHLCLEYVDTSDFTKKHRPIWIQQVDSSLNNVGNPIVIDSRRVDSTNYSKYFYLHERIEGVKQVGDYLIVCSEFNYDAIHRIYDLNGIQIDSLIFSHPLGFKNIQSTPDSTSITQYYTPALKTAIDYENLPMTLIKLAYSKCNKLFKEPFLPLRILKINNQFFVTGQNSNLNAECYILDSAWNITHNVSLKTIGSSIANKLISINDSMFAMVIEEGNLSHGVFEDETQSYIIIFDIKGRILKTHEIKTFGINNIRKITYNSENKAIEYIGTTTHFRIINGIPYDNIYNLDYFQDKLNIADLF